MANILTRLYKFVLGDWAGGLKTICRSGPIDRNSRPWKERKGKSDTSIDRDNIWQAFLAVLSNAIKKKLLFRSFSTTSLSVSVIFGPRSKCLKKKWFFHDEGFFIDRQGFHQFGNYSREEAYRSSMSPQEFSTRYLMQRYSLSQGFDELNMTSFSKSHLFVKIFYTHVIIGLF
jgi:hypothetical protein